MTVQNNSRSIRGFILLIILLVSTNIAILLNIPVYRQILGLFLLLLLPGMLILFMLKLNRLGLAEKIILSVGFSAAFQMIFGLLINYVCLSVGYTTPLSTHCLIFTLNLPLIGLLVTAYIRNPDAFCVFPFHIEINTEGKLGLLLPCFLPLLAILGMLLFNTSGNNVVLLASICLIPVSIIMMALFRRKLSTDTYSLAIIMITFALLAMPWLRSEHVFGQDVHIEYYAFATTLSNQSFTLLGLNTIDSCVGSSLLPAIFQSIMQIGKEEYLFKGIYALICIFTPLVVYVISKKYIGAFNAFLAAFFFTCQIAVIYAPLSPRTNLALFFFALCIMTLFTKEIAEFERKILFIVFMVATIFSHYSSAYIFFFLLLLTYLLTLLFKKSNRIGRISLVSVILFIAFIFVWYSEVIQTPFRAGTHFVTMTVLSLQDILDFTSELRGKQVALVFGTMLMNIIDYFYLVTVWLTYGFIAFGVIGTIGKRRGMVDSIWYRDAPVEFLKTKFDIEYFLMSIVCSGIAVLALLLPGISKYGLTRSFPQLLVVLSTFFILGGLMLAKFLKVRAHWLILLILIPNFMFVTSVCYEICGVHDGALRSPIGQVVLSNKVASSSRVLVYDVEMRSAQWLQSHIDEQSLVYAGDDYGKQKLISQGKFYPNSLSSWPFINRKQVAGFIWLSYDNIVNQKLIYSGELYNINDYVYVLNGKNKVYTNGGSEVLK